MGRSAFHPGFQVGQQRFCFVFVLLHDERLGQLAQQRDRHHGFGLHGQLRPTRCGLVQPDEGARDAFRAPGHGARIILAAR
jgi:hypothetical protein